MKVAGDHIRSSREKPWPPPVNDSPDNNVCISFGQLNQLSGLILQNGLISERKLQILNLILFHSCVTGYFHKAEDHIQIILM